MPFMPWRGSRDYGTKMTYRSIPEEHPTKQQMKARFEWSSNLRGSTVCQAGRSTVLANRWASKTEAGGPS